MWARWNRRFDHGRHFRHTRGVNRLCRRRGLLLHPARWWHPRWWHPARWWARWVRCRTCRSRMRVCVHLVGARGPVSQIMRLDPRRWCHRWWWRRLQDVLGHQELRRCRGWCTRLSILWASEPGCTVMSTRSIRSCTRSIREEARRPRRHQELSEASTMGIELLLSVARVSVAGRVCPLRCSRACAMCISRCCRDSPMCLLRCSRAFPMCLTR